MYSYPSSIHPYLIVCTPTNGYIHPVRLLILDRLIQPANSVFLSQQTSTSQPKPAQKPTSEHAVWVMWMVFIPYPFAPMVIFSIPLIPDEQKLSLSQAWCSQLPCSNLCDSLKDLALESVRKLENLLLHSCALGEALATWCVRYSWSLAPRWLAVSR